MFVIICYWNAISMIDWQFDNHSFGLLIQVEYFFTAFSPESTLFVSTELRKE